MKAIPLSVGVLARNLLNAARPPAEAPMPTTRAAPRERSLDRDSKDIRVDPLSEQYLAVCRAIVGDESAGLSPTLSPLLCASEPRWLACATASLASRRCRGRTGRHQGVSSRVGLIWCRHQREQAGPSARGANRERAPDFGNALAHRGKAYPLCAFTPLPLIGDREGERPFG